MRCENTAAFTAMAVRVGDIAVYSVASHPAEHYGDPPSLVLVHGLGLSHRYMMPLARELAREYQVHVPDQPGFGGSGHPEHVPDMAKLADMLAEWMRIGQIPRSTFVGNSQGCQIVAQIAVRHPELVAGAILQGPTAPPHERTWLWQAVRWRQNWRFNPPSLDAVSWSEYRKAGYLRVFRTFRHSLHDRIEEQLPHIIAPTLIVCGERDPICPVRWAKQLAALPPRGRYAEIPNVAHTLCFTAAAELAEVTRGFVQASTQI